MGDDPAVMRGSWIEADLDPETRARRRLDETPRAATRPRVEELWNKPESIAIVKDYRATRKSRPAQLDVARQMGFDTEQPLRDRLRALDIPEASGARADKGAAV